MYWDENETDTEWEILKGLSLFYTTYVLREFLSVYSWTTDAN